MVQLKAHLGDQWPRMNFLFLPIESDRADNDPSPTVSLNRGNSKEGRGLHWWLDFEFDLQVYSAYVPTPSQRFNAENLTH